MTNNFKKKDVAQIWSMLDKLALNDPASYRKFINEQMEMGKHVLAAPKPELMLKLKTKQYREKEVFLIICSWSRIPKTDVKYPINILDGEPYTVEDIIDNVPSEARIYPVAFCSELAEKYHSDVTQNLSKSQMDFIDTVIEHIDSKYNLRIDYSAPYEFCTGQYYGRLEQLHNSMGYRAYDPEQEVRKILEDTNDDDSDCITSDPSTLIDQMKDPEASDVLTKLQMPVNNSSLSKNTAVSIEEISAPYETKQTLHHIKFKISVGNTRSVDDLELDMNEEALHLENTYCTQFKPLDIAFPDSIERNSVETKFIPSKNLLIVRAKFKFK